MDGDGGVVREEEVSAGLSPVLSSLAEMFRAQTGDAAAEMIHAYGGMMAQSEPRTFSPCVHASPHL